MVSIRAKYSPVIAPMRLGVFSVWLEAVFFSTSRTVLCEMLSQKPSSTLRSANRRNVQYAWRLGAAQQAKAVILVRATPSMQHGCPERG